MVDSDRHGWTHPICETCWYRQNDRIPTRIRDHAEERCCGCGEPTTSGIFVRGKGAAFPKCPDLQLVDNPKVN